MTAIEISRLSRRLIRIADSAGLTITTVGISAANISDPKAFEIWDRIIDTARNYEGINGVNSFVVDFDEKVISFYVVLDSKSKKSRRELQEFSDELRSVYGDMDLEILDVIEM